ncbi:MAG: beta-lactamase family protein [Anaerolineales bacterium]|nr:beta-lactamase family protein [Anaerolineales bacterium]
MKRWLLSLPFLLLAWLLAGPASEVQAMAEPDPITPKLLNAANAAEFVDNYVAANMASMQVPGAAIVVVQGDEVLHAAGYGLADLAANRPVVVDETVFRFGSVSKLFTAAAVLQLAEQGQLRLDAPANDYLRSLQIPDNGGPPVTVADLLLHTAGFDDVFFGMHAREAADFESLAAFLTHHMPAQRYPAGTVISYNDHGYSLAGLVVEEVSGQSFESYLDENILGPLGMAGSTFAQPHPAAGTLRMAVGYRFDGAVNQPYAYDFVNVRPAAALSGPASDMVQFLRLQLNDGQVDGVQVLAPATVASMQTPQFRHHPSLRGRAYGFAEWQENGYQAFYHDGGNPGFLNRLMIIPEANLGYFVTFNGDLYGPATRFHRDFTTQFMDTFLPERAEPIAIQASGTLSEPAALFSGYYREVPAYSHDTLQKLKSLPEQFPVNVEGNRLQLWGRDYVETEPLIFRNAESSSPVVFRTTVASETQQLYAGAGAYERVPWYEALPVQLGLIGWFLLTFLSGIIVALSWRSAPGLLRGVLGVGSLLNLLFLVSMALVLLRMDPWQFIYGLPPIVLVLLALPLVTTVLALLLVPLAAAGWRQGEWSWLGRGYLVLASLTALGFPVFLSVWNLLGYKQ